MSQIPHILYVEDDLLSREIMMLVFRRVMENPNLTIFENSAQFMERLIGLPHQPSLILLDIYVEPYNGIELLHMLRAHPTYQCMPVAAVTASATTSELEKLHQYGFDGVIPKPVFAGTLPGHISRLLAGEKLWAGAY